MNLSRTRELFSSYFEGELEPGLRQQFEASLNASPELQDEFAEFVACYGELGKMAEEEIEVPIYLSDRIATRLEAAQAAKPRGLAWFLGGFQKLALGGLATVALFGALAGVNISQSETKDPFQMGLVKVFRMPWVPAEAPKPANVNPLEYVVNGSKISLTYQVKDRQTLMVDGKAIRSQAEVIDVPLNNENPHSVEMSVMVDGGNIRETIVVPGTERAELTAGTGLVNEFAKALADKYGVPVRLTVTELKSPLAWNLTASNAYEAAKAAFDKTGYSADKRENGMIVISGN